MDMDMDIIIVRAVRDAYADEQSGKDRPFPDRWDLDEIKRGVACRAVHRLRQAGIKCQLDEAVGFIGISVPKPEDRAWPKLSVDELIRRV